jgi:ABC-type branched-subunit amino acid transport system ATPase component
MTSAPIMEVKGLEKRFGAVVAATEINVEVHPRDRIGIIGTNGAGKTTFVNMVTGYLKPSSGDIRFEGRSVTGRPGLRDTNRAREPRDGHGACRADGPCASGRSLDRGTGLGGSAHAE